jgi:glycosyltransferase involved in cell wall biosynthesis
MNNQYSEPKISVIIPAYNAAEFIRSTLESVLAQDYQNLEVIVINDGSKDDTAKIVQSFGPPVQVVSTDNGGVARARNRGIQLAEGDFIAFLDADDLWEPDKISSQVEAIDEDHRLIYTDTHAFGVDNLPYTGISAGQELPSGDIRIQLIERNFIATSSVLMDRDICKKISGFNHNIPVGEDWDYWLRAISCTGAKYVNKPLVRYRVQLDSLSRNTGNLISGSLMVINSALSSLDIDPRKKRRLRKHTISGCYCYAATSARSNSQKLKALKLFATAYLYHPDRAILKEMVKTLIAPTLLKYIRPDKTA